MSKLTMTTFLTLDGIMQAPGGPKEDTSGDFQHGGWVFPFADEDMGHLVSAWFAQADAFLLGRGTYEIFAAHWPRVTDPGDPVASALNKLPKYVASRTLERATWQGTTIVRDVVGEVAALKRKYAREIQVHGSPGLAQTLIEHGLVDEYRLWVYPVILGKGKRLFGTGTVPSAFKHVETKTTRSGVVVAVYQPDGKPKQGSFALD